MMTHEQFDVFTVYKLESASSFLYVDCSDATVFMEGLADYILSETNLLNYANALTPIEFKATPYIYKKLYMTLSSFLNAEMELLTFDNVTQEIRDVLDNEYTFVNSAGELLIQKDKIGKIGEYTFHLLLTNYFKLHCIIPKFRCTTDRNMSVFGIDTLYLNPATHTIYFGESKVSKNLDNAIKLVNRSLQDYEEQIYEEYKLVLSNDEAFHLSAEFIEIFKEHTDVCISFSEFIKAANIDNICIPIFLAHGNDKYSNKIEDFLHQMNQRIKKRDFFGLNTSYLLISLPIIDKTKMMNVLMRKVVKKHNEYESQRNAL